MFTWLRYWYRRVFLGETDGPFGSKEAAARWLRGE